MLDVFKFVVFLLCKTWWKMEQSKSPREKKGEEKREEALGTRKEEESGKKKDNGEIKKKKKEREKRISRSAFAVKRPRGRDRRQKHRRLTSARNHSAADPGKIRSPIVCIEIRSCRNAPRGTISAPSSLSGTGGRKRDGMCAAWYSKKKPRASPRALVFLFYTFSFIRKIVAFATSWRDAPRSKANQEWILFQDRILARLFEHPQHRVQVHARCLAYIWYEMYSLIGSNTI